VGQIFTDISDHFPIFAIFEKRLVERQKERGIYRSYNYYDTHIFGGVCAWGYNNVLPSIFAHHNGHKCLPQTADILPHLRLDAATTRQRHAAQPDRSGGMAHHGAGTLTSANRGSPGHGTGFGARRFHSLEPSGRKLSGAVSSHGGRPVCWPMPNQRANLGRRPRPAPPDL